MEMSSAAAEQENGKMHGIHADESSEDIVIGEPTVGHVEPKSPELRLSMEVHVPIDTTMTTSVEPFRWATYAVDDDGNEVSELDYLQNFQKRHNKVMLDKLAIETEKSKLMEENAKLQVALRGYLDGVTLSDEAKAKYNALMDIGSCKLGSKPTLPVLHVATAKKKRIKAQE